MTPIAAPHLHFITEAQRYLENPKLLTRLSDYVGRPLEAAVDRLPAPIRRQVTRATRQALESALSVAIATIGKRPANELTFDPKEAGRQRWAHGLVAMAAGGASGFAGGWALGVELPFSTTLMLRAIAATAQDYGFSLDHPETRLECLSVFALGGPSPADDALDSAYFTERAALAALVRDAAAFMGRHTAEELSHALSRETAPVLVRFLVAIAERFEVSVSEKLIAQAVPVLGAVGGATVNLAFSTHFAKTASFHFGLRRLEQLYSQAQVREAYLAATRAEHTKG